MKSAVLLIVAATATASLAYACSSSSSGSTSNVDAGGTEVQAADCDIGAATFPKPGCGELSCAAPTGATCAALDEAKCGSKSTCLPMTDNAGKSVLDMRIRRLNVVAPPSLAAPLIQNVVVTKNIDLKAACGDTGNGAFNWLLRVDRTANTLTTGGAPPSADPFTDGYCFFRGRAGGIDVAPTVGAITFTGNTFAAAPVDKLNIPIFINGDVNNVVVLPISYGTIKDVTISTDGNCIGSFNAGSLGADCSESGCTKWTAGGTLAGYITLEEADGVDVADLSESLCVLITKSEKGADKKCLRDASGKIKASGDYCSTTRSAGGCADSYWMSATFAASATKITDGTGRAGCDGATSSPDAGPDGAVGAVRN